MALSISNCMAAFALLGAFLGLRSQEVTQTQPTPQIFPTMASALDAIGSRYGVPMGLEYAANDPDRLPISLDLSHAAITAMDTLVTQKSAYTWKLDGGVYDVYPASCYCSICLENSSALVGVKPIASPATLRSQVFLCGALLGRAGHRLVLHLSASWGGLKPSIPLLENVLSYGVTTSPKLYSGLAT
jgi:hypothetical protein